MNAGIDYGKFAGSNRNKETGIHYGVISQGSLNPEVINDVVLDGADYGEAKCPKCGGKAIDANENLEASDVFEPYSNGCTDYLCMNCKHTLDSSQVFSAEMLGWAYEKDGYKLQDCLNNDVFVIESPFYTYAQFCSPCVPGAGNLDSPLDTSVIPFGGGCRHFPADSPMARSNEICADCEDKLGPKVYCLGHDWFEQDRAPYRVFKVSDDSEVLPAETAE